MSDEISVTVRFLADHNFNEDIVGGLLSRERSLDVIRTRDHGLEQTPDPDLLEWAAREGRVILTHDEHTLIGFAYDRVRRGCRCPGS